MIKNGRARVVSTLGCIYLDTSIFEKYVITRVHFQGSELKLNLSVPEVFYLNPWILGPLNPFKAINAFGDDSHSYLQSAVKKS